MAWCGVSRGISPAELKKIEAAIPAKAVAKPAKPRKLLVFRRSKGHVHTAIPYGAKAIELMGRKTGAFEAVHSKAPAVLRHYLDGIQFALGDLPADTTPSASDSPATETTKRKAGNTR